MKDIQEMKSVIALDYVRRRKHFQTITARHQMVLLGDSMIAFLSLKRFGLDDTVQNLGIAGDTTQGVLNRLSDLDPLFPTQVIVSVGSNDLVLTNHTIDDIIQNIHKIRDLLESKGIPVTIVSMTPVNRNLSISNMDYIQHRTNDDLLDINRRLKDSLPEAAYIDVFFPLLDQNGDLSAEYTTDGIHLNHQGYAIYLSQLKLI